MGNAMAACQALPALVSSTDGVHDDVYDREVHDDTVARRPVAYLVGARVRGAYPLHECAPGQYTAQCFDAKGVWVKATWLAPLLHRPDQLVSVGKEVYRVTPCVTLCPR